MGKRISKPSGDDGKDQCCGMKKASSAKNENVTGEEGADTGRGVTEGQEHVTHKTSHQREPRSQKKSRAKKETGSTISRTTTGTEFFDAPDGFSQMEESSQGELSFHEELSDEGVSEHGTEEDVTGGGKAEGTGSCMPIQRSVSTGDMNFCAPGLVAQELGKYLVGERSESKKGGVKKDDVEKVPKLAEREANVTYSKERNAHNTWSDADVFGFVVRSHDYMKNRVKTKTKPPPYSPTSFNIYSAPAKVDHLTPKLNLPEGPGELDQLEGRIPRFLVLNLLAPQYTPPVFSRRFDGPTYVAVMMFELNGSEISEPALRLLEGVYKNWRSKDEHPLRERLKMIANVRNFDKLAKERKLGRPEMTLLSQYNGKPVLMRPCHRVYVGSHYMEIDFDVHLFSFFPRQVWHSAAVNKNLLSHIVADIGILIQGDHADELPEQLLACLQCSCLDLEKEWPTLPPSPD